MWQHVGHKQYDNRGLDLRQLKENPFYQMLDWLEEAEFNEPEAHAMALSTCDPLSLRPSCRMVLIKKIDAKGFYFFSHYDSRKGKEMASNAQVSGLFYWPRLERQVIVEGTVELVDGSQSDKYFLDRPLESQVATSVSRQGQVIESRDVLLEKYHRGLDKASQIVPKRPPWWGGYCLIPFRFEFWQGREHRLHDRFQYIQRKEDWQIQRLSP